MEGRVTLRRLKEETAALHARAEQFVRILDEDASVADYHRYLVAMLGYHDPLERLLAGHAGLVAAGFEAERGARRELLERDLANLGDVRTAWPACPRLPDVESLPRAIGAAYVLEGSTLGGRYILAKLPQALAGLRGRATAFLEGHGDSTGPRWRSFADVVERAVATRENAHLTVAGACETFARLIDWLAQHEQPSDRPPARPMPLVRPRPAAGWEVS